MADQRLKLVDDLAKKLDRLGWMCEQPVLFIAEHFASIRNEIDYETERLIQKLGDGSSLFAALGEEKIVRFNLARSEFIEFLDNKEQNLYRKLQETPSYSTLESFNKLKMRVDEFSASKESSDICQVEETYVQIALDIIDATYELEKRLFDGQTIAYVPRNLDSTIGNLVYLNEDYLNRDELSCLRLPNFNYQNGNMSIFVYQATQASLDKSLVVAASRPFVLTRNLVILIYISEKIQNSSDVILCMGSSSTDVELRNRPKSEQMVKTWSISPDMSSSSKEAVCLPKMPQGYLASFLFLFQNRLRNFEVNESLMQNFFTLDLRHNQLESFNEDLFSKGTKLQKLILANAFLPDTRFSLGFLSTLTELSNLELTLTDTPVDFDAFKNLTKMHTLVLHSAASLDSSIQRPELTLDHFEKLFMMPRLATLRLSHFEIKRLLPEMLNGFNELNVINLSDNCITHVGDGVFSKLVRPNARYKNDLSGLICLQRNSLSVIKASMFQNDCSELDLSYNRIDQLLQEAFGALPSLSKLHLNNNSIRHIEPGVFTQMTQLIVLNLDFNSIDSIQTDTFEGLEALTNLSLSNCQLKSIDNFMFSGLKRLAKLDLKGNQIKAFEVVTDSGRKTVDGILSPAEFELVKSNLFCGMTLLWGLILSGNKLEKLDLNCFCNLITLSTLEVSDNCIREINEEIRPKVLAQLKSLDLSNNQLTHLSRNAFSNSTQLRFLNLSGNRLNGLKEGFFDPFEKLDRLNLKGNNLSLKVTRSTFARCANIFYLNLSDNPNVSVDDGALRELNVLRILRLELRKEDSQRGERFLESMKNLSFVSMVWNLMLSNSSLDSFEAFKAGHGFSNLRRLELNGNRIKYLSRESLSGLPNLAALDLSGNLIETLDDPDLFKDLPNIETLILRGNKLKQINRELFKGLNRLESLDLSNNPGLSSIDSGIFRALFNLKKLQLAGNNIASFDLALLFRSCRVLECLDLSDNQLDGASVNEASMNGVTASNLKELMLANNRLQTMDFVRRLYRLEKLDLSGNKIESVTSDGINLFSRLTKLIHVNLSSNELKSMDIKTVFSHLQYQLEFIDMSNNPFNTNTAAICNKNCHAFIENS